MKNKYWPSVMIVLMICAFITSCIKTQPSRESDLPANKHVALVPNQLQSNQVVSLLGNILPPKHIPERVKENRLNQLEEARTIYEADPKNEENIILYGRRLAYVGRYEDAINIYSVGLDLKPNCYRLLRHRGHRYITIREFDKAIEDLQQAVFYSRNEKNAVEPDGLPNRLNTPLSNDKFNIWYHLGIAYFLKGNYDKAISSFKRCKEFADNQDLIVAVNDWFYLTYKKTGNDAAANEILSEVASRMRIIEYGDYYKRLQMYKGEIAVEDLLDEAESDNESLDPTLGYGIASFYLLNGDVQQAKTTLSQILNHYQWDAFGYIAAEVDMITLGNLK